jgi:subtilisin family serine protease
VFTPPAGETRFRNGEVVVELPNSISPATVALVLRNHRLTEARVIDDALLGTSVRLWRYPDSRAVASVMNELGVETSLLSIQPNYIYELEEGTDAAPAPQAPVDAADKKEPAPPEGASPSPVPAASAPTSATAAPAAPAAAAPPAETATAPTPPAAPSGFHATLTTTAPETDAPKPASAISKPAASAISPLQYYLAKLNVDEGMVGDPVRVAVIDTAVDETHPDLAGAVEARYNAIEGAGAPRSLGHGTSIAGAIAARGRLKGVAPNVRILSARAFDTENGKSKGDTTSIVDAINWVEKQDARVVNMSFAGPQDSDLLHRNLAAALAKGMMLVGAAGNAGPKSPPLYPAADESVFAVTATDAEDKLYAMANVGAYIAVSAPGVDVLLPAPHGGYSLETGTSVSAALVSGVAALLLERRVAMTPAELRRVLMTTATPLGTKGEAEAFGAGLVDARKALSAQAAPPPTD